MTSKEFILWLKGFTEGVHEFNITPKQWDLLKDKLAEVKDEPTYSFPTFTPNTAPMPLPHFPNPLDNPYTINCGSGSSGTITTTPNGGSITYATPQFVTSTATGYPSGSNWSYTNSTYNVPYTTAGEDEVIKTHNED
jgi:hypothetical protein